MSETSPKKILILLGNPYAGGMCGKLADSYEQAARSAGHEVTRINVGELQFDAVLHQGYRAIQELEPDLQRFRQLVTECDHFVIIYPVWWGGMPALLKGLFDRAWLPGSQFRYIKTKAGKRTIFWHRLMKGKTARVIMTSGTSPWIERLFPGRMNASLRWSILWFAGFSVKTTWFGPAESVPDKTANKWVRFVSALGREGQ